jgi:ubiquinol-cytochrome c reductase cytochrome c subunit
MPIADPKERVEPREPKYSPATIKKIVDYISTFNAPGPAIPRPDPAAGDLALGNTLYQANCAACHSATAVGGTLTQGIPQDILGEVDQPQANRAPGLLKSSAVEIAEAMLTGPGTMPVFGDETISAPDRNAIVRYILYLQTASDRGGGNLGRVGPVAEGAIAWIVGLGALLILARWLGKSVRQRG